MKTAFLIGAAALALAIPAGAAPITPKAVSYTHLTLPTKA